MLVRVLHCDGGGGLLASCISFANLETYFGFPSYSLRLRLIL